MEFTLNIMLYIELYCKVRNLHIYDFLMFGDLTAGIELWNLNFFLLTVIIGLLKSLFCVTESPPPPYSRLSPNEEHKPLGK